MTGISLRTAVIRAGFPYHKSPGLYQWLPAFVFLPFSEENSISELAERHGRKLRGLYDLLRKYPDAFEKFVRVLTRPLFFEILSSFGLSDATGKSRRRVRIIIDDTKSEKFGKRMEFIHKLYDHSKKRYIMGYSYVLMIVSSGDMIFPLSFVLWLPEGHPDHRSKNDIARDELIKLKSECDKKGFDLGETEFLTDSGYCVQKVIRPARNAGLRIITKPANTHKFGFGNEKLTPKEIIGKITGLQWKYLCPRHCYQRVRVRHHVYGSVVLIIRRRRLKNGKIIYDALMCDKIFYNSVRIHKSYKKRWEIEMCFKYYKQYLLLGKSRFGKIASVRSALSCVAIAGLIVTLFRRRFFRKISFRHAVRLISRELFET